ncbi:hypothetical protein CIRG_06660 [Coccidioides immitis RMSCC 2394]|uniref:Uncharacterized protein n=1 Tax=Coccidioides immitis RMSCC 2394 TaxID=404692 RepID=A0A0J6YIQ3_COCIT|nr:hypothetical protein CIRG_06660 [Coccidioides immitis RMSCC 2394]
MGVAHEPSQPLGCPRTQSNHGSCPEGRPSPPFFPLGPGETELWSVQGWFWFTITPVPHGQQEDDDDDDDYDYDVRRGFSLFCLRHAHEPKTPEMHLLSRVDLT